MYVLLNWAGMEDSMFMAYCIIAIVIGFICAVAAAQIFGFGLLGAFLVYTGAGFAGFIVTVLLTYEPGVTILKRN